MVLLEEFMEEKQLILNKEADLKDQAKNFRLFDETLEF